MTWIKTTDKLPEPGERVLTYNEETGIQSCYITTTGIWRYCFNMTLFQFECTHWMPLPPTPEDEILNALTEEANKITYCKNRYKY